MSKDLVIAVKSVETRKFVGAVTRVEFKKCKDLGGKCGSIFTWATNPKKALRFHNQLNATEVCVWLCSSDNYVFNKEGYELVIITYDRLIEIYESSKKLEQTKQEATKVDEKNKKALEIIKKTWGSRILNDLQSGFVLGSPYAVLPQKEETELLKEMLK